MASSPRKEAERRIRICEEKRKRHLNLSEIGLDAIPRSIGRVKHVKQLVVDDGTITRLPDELAELQDLQSLSINGHRPHLNEFPKIICELKSLKSLDLGRNAIDNIPDEISNLTNLEILELKGNQLEHLPDVIGDLSQLTDLYLSFNPLRELPDSIGKLDRLDNLSVNHTKLKELPRSLGRLPKLRYIQINKCTELAPQFAELSHKYGSDAIKATEAIKYLLRGDEDPDNLRFQSMDDFRMPDDLRAAVEKDDRPVFDFEEADQYAFPPIRLRGASELGVEWLGVRGFDGAGGPWSIPCVRLMREDGSEIDSSDILLWLPVHKRYGTFNPSHSNLFVFHKATTWAAIAADFPTYFFATNNGGDPDEKYAVYYEDSDCFDE